MMIAGSVSVTSLICIQFRSPEALFPVICYCTSVYTALYVTLYERVTVLEEQVTVSEAAARLSISEGAVRQRINRGTLAHEKGKDGRIFVLLHPDTTDMYDEQYAVQYDVQNQTMERLLQTLEQQNEFLRSELERKDAILMSLVQRVPELEAPADATQSTTAAADGEEQGMATPESEHRSWWRRIFQ
jgi:hypothetical protein